MQIHLRRLLGVDEDVEYFHLPLVTGPDGRKLAKRHGDTKLATYIREGVSVHRILGLLGYWSGLLERREEIDLPTLQARFDLDKIGPEPVVFTQQDDQFLRA
jgi:glutamyl-tRNA synthetase